MFQRRDGVCWRLLADRVLLQPVSGPGYTLTSMSAAVWVVLDVPRSLLEVCAELEGAGIDTSGVAACLDELVAADVVVCV